MFKKICLLALCLALFGCNKSNDDSMSKNLQNSLKKAKSYTISGDMELYSDEDTFKYEITVSHSDTNYMVSMINKSNDKEQVILKNSDGLYVITPSLNKSFKFDSTWPTNSSQIYILESVLSDINNDDNVEINKNDKYIRCKVKYPNNPDLSYEKIYLNDNNDISKIEVYDETDILKIKLEISSYDINCKIDNNIYKLDNYVKKEECSGDDCKSKTTLAKIEEAIYPLYMPANTYLNNSEMVNAEDNSRVILTFSGDSNFVIVEQPTVANEEMEIIPVYGNPLLINDNVAAVSNNSIYWTSGNIDYYLASQDLTQEQMIAVVSSLGNTKSVLATTK